MENYIEKGGYIEAVGRRKSATARVRISKVGKEGDGFVVNGKDIKDYFPTVDLVSTAKSPLETLDEKMRVSVVVKGGGTSAQADAVRHGIARSIVAYDETQRKLLKKLGFLTRDSRVKERKKFGLRKARKAPQWSKR